MQTKTFIDPEEVTKFINDLHDKGYAVDLYKTDDETFKLNWIKLKKFTNVMDNVEYTDEIWTKEDGTMINCQDLDLPHAQNIIRMMLRNDREQRKVQQEIIASIQEAIATGDFSNIASTDDEVDQDISSNRVLH